MLGSLIGRRLNGSSWTEKFKQVTINDLVTDICELLADSSYYNLIFLCLGWKFLGAFDEVKMVPQKLIPNIALEEFEAR